MNARQYQEKSEARLESITDFVQRLMKPRHSEGPEGPALVVRRVKRDRLPQLEMAEYLRALEDDDAVDLEWRPRSRRDCAQVPRPCPFVGCRHNLWLDTTASGAFRINHAVDPEALSASCALDEASAGPATLAEVGRRLNITRERVRQIEAMALKKLGKRGDLEDFESYERRPEAQAL